MVSRADTHEAVYLHVAPESLLPEWKHRKPFNAVVVATQAVSDEWQDLVSDWLVKSGCLCMLAWGVDCIVWDDTVDHATRKFYDPGEIPDEGFVLTTWHTDDSLEDVFWQAQFVSNWTYGDQHLDLTLILDISDVERGSELLALFDQSIDFPKRSPDRTYS